MQRRRMVRMIRTYTDHRPIQNLNGKRLALPKLLPELIVSDNGLVTDGTLGDLSGSVGPNVGDFGG
jgi:hypothetical protein